MPSKPLFDEDSSNEEEGVAKEQDTDRIHVNQRYAKEYQTKKLRQELQQHGDASIHSRDDDSDSSEDESEDEDGYLLTPNMDVSIIKTINALRNKEKSIYDSNTKFFPEDADNEEEGSNEPEQGKALKESNNSSADKREKKKKLHFKDVLREQILDQIKENEQDNLDHASTFTASSINPVATGTSNHKNRLLYDEEQEKLRSDFINLHEKNNVDDDDQADNLLVVKKNRVNPVVDQDLQREFEILEKTTVKGQLQDPRGEIEDADQFLLDFIKNKKWVDKDDIHYDNDEGSGNQKQGNNIVGLPNDQDDDSIDEVDRADDFESKYNFRFEEAQSEIQSGADFSVIGYARSQTVDTLRRKDDTRRQKRLERQERKAAERKAKEEQLRRLKNAKRQEMELKLSEIKKVIGSAQDVDEDALMKLMEGDFDPEKFETLMQATYGEDFYDKEETEWKSDLDVRNSLMQDEDGTMLVGGDDIDGGLYDQDYNAHDDNNNQGEDDEYHDEDSYAEGDNDDYGNHNEDDVLPTAVETKLKSKIQEELYKLDYEDIVAGIPTRFKYRKVEPNNFGLSTQEILLARDTTLKNFVSLKKIAPYRDDREYTVGHKKRRRFREMLQEDLKEEMEPGTGIVNKHPNEEKDEVDVGKKKRRRQKKRKVIETATNTEEEQDRKVLDNYNVTSNGETATKKRKRRRSKKLTTVDTESHQAEPSGFDDGKEKVKNGIINVSMEASQQEISEAIQATLETSSGNKIKGSESKANNTKKKRKNLQGNNARKMERNKSPKSKIDGVSSSRLKAYGL